MRTETHHQTTRSGSRLIGKVLFVALTLLNFRPSLFADCGSGNCIGGHFEYRDYCSATSPWPGTPAYDGTPNVRYLKETIEDHADAATADGGIAGCGSAVIFPGAANISAAGNVSYSVDPYTNNTWYAELSPAGSLSGMTTSSSVTSLPCGGFPRILVSSCGSGPPWPGLTGHISYTPTNTDALWKITQFAVGGGSTVTNNPELVCCDLGLSSRTATVRIFTNTPGWTAATRTYTLTQPYTRGDAQTNNDNTLGSCSGGVWNENPRWASSSSTGSSITSSKVGYRLVLPETEQDVVYHCSWKVRTPYSDHQDEYNVEEDILGTGDKAVGSEWVLVGPSDGDASFVKVDETTLVVTSNDGSGCADCLADAGAACQTLGSAEVHFPLGKSLYDRGGAQLYFHEDPLTATSSTPAALKFSGKTSLFDVITTGQGLRQVKGAKSLADIVVTSSSSYDIRYYSLTNVGSKSTVYATSGIPFVVWSIVNPDGGSGTNRLQLVETRGAKVITNEYGWSGTTKTWSLLQGNGLRLTTKTIDYDSASKIRTETKKIYTGTNQLVLQEVRKYTPWLTEVRVGLPGSEITTTNAIDGNGRVSTVTRSDGSWETYNYDVAGRVSSLYKPTWVNTPPSAYDCWNYDFTTNTIGWDDMVNLSDPRATRVSLNTTPVRYHWMSRDAGYRVETDGANGGNGFDPGNQIASSTTYTNGSFSGYARSRKNKDNTITSYFYATNATQKTITTLTGQAATGSDTNVISGTKTAAIVGLAGQPLCTTVYAIPETNVIVSQEVYSDFDELLRPGRITYLDGTSVTNVYNCCGLEYSVDRSGTRTDYGYDDLKRLTSETRNGVTTIYTYDGANRRLTTVRQGSDSSQVYLDRSGYDTAGRLIAQTNSLGGVTSYFETNVAGQMVKTTIFPDLGTQTNTYARDGSLVSTLGTAVPPAKFMYGLTNIDGVNTVYYLESKLNTSGATNGWVITILDQLQQPYKKFFSDGALERTTYNQLGQVTNQVDADGVITLYRYNGNGERQWTALDTNRNYLIDYSANGGNDGITMVTNDIITNSYSVVVRRSRTFVWSTLGSDASNLVASTEVSMDGLQSWSSTWNNGTAITTHSQTVLDPAHGLRVVTVTGPDNSYTVSTNQYGRDISVTRFDSLTNQLSSISFGYDAHGRRNTVTDARTGTSTSYFNAADQISGTLSPVPGAQVTSNFFDLMGRVIASKLADNTYVTNRYDVTGLLTNTFGSRTYPVAYTYDAQGRMKTMKTWKNYAGNSGAATTTWNYDVARGWLTNKTYEGGVAGPTYTYTAAGRLATRVWARGITTTYGHDNLGNLSSVSYSDGATTGCSYVYDRRGRQVQLKEGSTLVTSYHFDDAGDLLGEVWSSGPLSGLTVTNVFDSLLRRATNGVWNGTSWLTQTRYSYDNASRLATVSDGTNTAGYSYLANSPLVSQIGFTNAGVQRMVTTKQYDMLNRLTNIASTSSAGPVASFAYVYNSANQRTKRTDVDSSYWIYTYDSLGQVTSGKRYWSDGTPVAGQQFEYAFDDIGNRTSARAGGDQAGANLRSADYGANNLNQYTNRSVPPYVDIQGEAATNATVSIWSSGGENAPTYRRGEFYRGELLITNTPPLWLTITNLAVLNNGTNADIITNSVGNAFVAQTPETFTYDADGNLTSDGRWTNTWDAENRLVKMESLTNGPPASKLRLSFGYDHQGRRLSKQVDGWNGSIWSASISNLFAYDGWDLIGEYLGATRLPVRSWAWGVDFGGRLAPASGRDAVGFSIDSNGNAGFFAPDGIGNPAAVIQAATGLALELYEYGPAGEPLRIAEPTAGANTVRFSGKYEDAETRLVYHGARYLDRRLGRWLSRDPLDIEGGENIYGFGHNDQINFMDPLGMEVFEIMFWTYIETPTITDPFQSVFRGDNHGSTGSGTYRTIHRIMIETCGSKKGLLAGSEWKDVGVTEKLDPKTGAVIKTAKASGSTLKASVTTNSTSVIVKMEGNESNPLHDHAGVSAPGITYHATIVFDTAAGLAKYSGTHDEFPSFQGYVGKKRILDWSHVEAGTGSRGLFHEDISFSGGFRIKTASEQ
jgi:RHS repeat-associated protein